MGFEFKDREAYVCRLKKALYGLKQAPKAWYPNLYFKVVKGEPVIILLYVDDLLLISV